jgi:hypothetical protein
MYVVIASDDNPRFIQRWPLVAEFWGSLGFNPVLSYVANNSWLHQLPKTNHGEVIRFEPYGHLSVGVQAKFSRWFCASFLRRKHCMIADMDLLPLFTPFFTNLIRHCSKKHILYTNQHRDIVDFERYSSNYLIGSGVTFYRMINRPRNFADYMRDVERYEQGEPNVQKVIHNQLSDEIYIAQRILDNDIRTKKFNFKRYSKRNPVCANKRLRLKMLPRDYQRLVDNFDKVFVDVVYTTFDQLTKCDEKAIGIFFQMLEHHRLVSKQHEGNDSVKRSS